ncbi:MAG: excinuclease ABC subunit UvrB [Bacteroidaceae bacterium]|nr:excinuclease ABC subunit UvrB [Bacteroidaceae bacterium]
MPSFDLVSSFAPTGDQPEAIRQLTDGVLAGTRDQVLLGVTGSGKTFTIANVIQNVGRPTLVLSHNKTLAAQLYQEFKGFFPNNCVEYYVSYYDYYQPEAYIPSTGKYIEKELQINEDIDRMRIAATCALLSGRKDVIIVSSVSCIYGMGNPSAFYENLIELRVGQTIGKNALERKLVKNLYVRNDADLNRGYFRVKGDTIDVALAYSDKVLRIRLWDDEIDSLQELDALSYQKIADFDDYRIYPANLFITSSEVANAATKQIENDLWEEEAAFRAAGKTLEADRLHERVTYDVQMIRELGYCSGIENYSRYFDGRAPGTRPYCLLDFFPKDFLLVIDESHVTVGQVSGMYGGDRSRKENLVEYGYRLPAAFDNRPLNFSEFKQMTGQTIYVSATPADYELGEAGGVVVEQLIRPTGLLDPKIVVRSSDNQIDDLMEEIQQRSERDERVLVTTISKQSAEDLTEYLLNSGMRANYIHSDVDTMDRVKILEQLRRGEIDVLVGVNLLREGLDLPEVSLVAILDADKSGFLRDARSLTQTAGRAARNVNGLVIMYADTISEAMQTVIDESERRRARQQAYNAEHHITPTPIVKDITSPLLSDAAGGGLLSPLLEGGDGGRLSMFNNMAAEPDDTYGLENETIESLRAKMERAAKNFDFILAARYRDEIKKREGR